MVRRGLSSDFRPFVKWIVKAAQGRRILTLSARRVKPQAPRLHGWCEKKIEEKDHGRLETRENFQSAELGWFADKDQWEELKSVGMVQATRQINGQISTEKGYYLSSLPLDIDRFSRAVRGYWGMENKLHWVMDVRFGEDQSRVLILAQNQAL